METILFLVGFAILLFIVTVVGHGVWLLFANLFGKAKDEKASAKEIKTNSVPSAESDLKLTYAAIDRMFRAGLIERDTFESLARSIEAASVQMRLELPPIIAKLRSPNDSDGATVRGVTPLPLNTVERPLAEQAPPHFELDSVVPGKADRPPPPVAPVHALDRDYEPEPPRVTQVISKQSHRALGDVLQQFLSEKNIQWGELLSALLIVGSAIGLILSLRTQLNQLIPMFPAVLFFLVTVAIHLAGFYTLKKWKLPSTSRGLLVLGSLMMTITALATSLLSKSEAGEPLTTISFLAPTIIGGIGFAILAYHSGRSLFPSQPILWSLSLVVVSLIPGFVNRLAVNTQGVWEFGWLSALTLLGLAVATGSLMPASFRAAPSTDRLPALGSQLRLFGIALFGTVVSVGLLLFRTKSQLMGATVLFAMPASISGALLMCAGGHFGRQWKIWNAVKQPGESSKLLDSVVMLGTSLTMLGGALFLMSLGLSQSNSDIFLVASILNCLLAIGLAILWNQPALTAMATLFGSLGVWLIAHRWQGIPPDSAISSEWISKAIPTVLTSTTSMVLAVVTGSLGYLLFKLFPANRVAGQINNPVGNAVASKSVEKSSAISHATSLMVGAAIHGLIAFGVSGYLGANSTRQPDLIFAIGTMAVIAVAAMVAGRLLANELILVVGSVFVALALAILGRTNTELARTIGIQDWSFSYALILVCLLHAVVILIAMKALEYVKPAVEHKTQDNGFRVFGATGIASALIPTPFLINWELGLAWHWHALWLASIAGIFLCHWLLGRFVPGPLQNASVEPARADSTTDSASTAAKAVGFGIDKNGQASRMELLFIQFLALVVGSAALCFGLAAVLVGLPQLQAVPALAFAVGVAVTTLTAAIMAIAAKHISRSGFLGVFESPFGDVLFGMIGAYQLTHIWAYWFAWSRAVRLGASFEAPLWTFAFLALMTSVCLLAALRNRFFYIWISGALSVVVSFMLLVMWFPTGSDVLSLLSLMATAPILIALGFTIRDAVRFLRNREVYVSAPELAIYEMFTGVVTVVLWGLLTTLALFMGAIEPDENVYGLFSGTALVWFSLGMILFAVRSLIETSLRFVVLFQIGSLLVFLHLPILLMRVFSIEFNPQVYLALIVVGASLHALALVWFAVQGHRLGRAILTQAQIVPSRAPEGAIELSRTHIVWLSNLILALSVIYVVFVNISDAIRLMALSVAMIGFALLGLDRFMPNSKNWTATIRSMVIAASGMFVIYLVWSGVTQTEWSDVWVSRVLRVTGVLLIANMILCGIYVWITGTLANEVSSEQNAGHPNLAIHLSEWLAFSKGNQIGAWSDTITRHWHFSSLLSLVLMIVGMILMVVTKDQANLDADNSGASARKIFSAEALWVVSLSGIWIVQLVVQAIRLRWNVAQLFLKMRSTYVYLAEVVFCLAAIQLYLVHPEWFRLPLREYWPIIMLVVAVIGQGIAQLLKRSGVETVGEPLANTSLILPVAASVGMLSFATEAKPDVVMALGGLFYFFLGATEGSRRLAMLGGVFANAALLLYWKRFDGLDFQAHPQLWLIPPAASIAVATHFASDRMNAETRAWVRYLAMATIFLSSSSEILLQGLGKQLWPPMVLMVLSVATIFLGISFQVRSYLYSGLIFTLLALIAMVAHAQQSLNHTWPWWALGISMGISILVLFGLFEKKREQFNKVAERLKAWNG